MAKKDRIRQALIESIKRDVPVLLKIDRAHHLNEVMDLTGFMSNFTTHTAKDLAGAIVALAPLLAMEDLCNVAHAARHGVVRSRRRSYDYAQKVADDAVRACGVDVEKWDAAREANDRRLMAQAFRGTNARAA